ncbi:MAG TPA: AmmeMemoRadiSam system protein A [Dissulfurispiraceae bacterium]|nr:AmmeMemoRadiSam system protein A [Dissulfurispiraceae bacterium]
MHPYVELAKEAVEQYVRHRKTLCPGKDISPEMKRRAGVFICLKKRGDLRGCIGTFSPVTDNLYLEIVRNAISAAMEDPRFYALDEQELAEIEYTVDVLSEPEKVESLSDLDPKKYGVIVVKGYRKGLLLPDLEGVDTAEDQLRITKMKAGIERSETDIDIYRFTVERYK